MVLGNRRERFKTVFLEKYRPSCLEEIILDAHIKQKMEEYIKSGRIPSLLFVGQPGTGKTSLAYILIDQIIKNEADYIEINGSLLRGIDTIRGFDDFIKTPPLESKIKIIFIDEADKLTNDSQDSLRNLIEQNSAFVSFILTANYQQKITDALKSRLETYYFSVLPKENISSLIKDILKKENIQFEEDAIDFLIKETYPDIRRCLNEINKFVIRGSNGEGKRILNLDLLKKSNVLMDEKFVNMCLELIEKKNLENNIRLIYDWIYNEKIDFVRVLEKLNMQVKNIKLKTLTAKMYNDLFRVVSPKMLMIEFVGLFVEKIFSNGKKE